MAVPSAITDLSTTASSNSPAGSDAVGNTLDDYLRAGFAIQRAESLNKSWERWFDTPTRTGATTFTVATDLTARYVVGRRIKCIDSSTLYGTIASASFGAGVTTVTVTLDSGSLSASLTEVQLGTDALGSSVFTSDIFRLQDSADKTKKVAFSASGLTTGTTRTLTVPDISGTLALTSNKLSAFAATTSSELKGVISDETGSGALVFANTPTLVTPNIGAATGTSLVLAASSSVNSTTNGTLFTAQTGALWRVAGPDATVCAMELNSFGAASRYYGVRSNGTSASKSAVALGQSLVTFDGAGYDGTAVSDRQASITFVSGENWDSSHHGTIIVFNVTPNASTSLGEAMRIDSKSNILLGYTGSTGVISTSATDGMPSMPTCAGSKTATPTAYTGMAQFVYDTTGNKLWIWNPIGGAWKSVALA